MSWLRIARIGWRKIGSDERSTAAASCLDFLTTGALFSDSVDLLTQSDSQAISFGSSLHESGSVSLLTLTQIFESLKYTKAGAFPLFSHSCMRFPRNGLNCRNMDGIGQKSNIFYTEILFCKTVVPRDRKICRNLAKCLIHKRSGRLGAVLPERPNQWLGTCSYVTQIRADEMPEPEQVQTNPPDTRIMNSLSACNC
jgi:hypothetical protein